MRVHFQLSPGNCQEGYVAFGMMEEEQWLVKGKISMNRAMEGDCVVAELLPKYQWSTPERAIHFRDQEEVQPDVSIPVDGEERGESSSESSDESSSSGQDQSTSPKSKRIRKSVNEKGKPLKRFLQGFEGHDVVSSSHSHREDCWHP